MSTYDAFKKSKLDLYIVPVCISHERIFDVKMLSQDIEVGHLNSRRGGLSIIRQIFSYRKGKLGSANVQFGTPISMTERFKNFQKTESA